MVVGLGPRSGVDPLYALRVNFRLSDPTSLRLNSSSAIFGGVNARNGNTNYAFVAISSGACVRIAASLSAHAAPPGGRGFVVGIRDGGFRIGVHRGGAMLCAAKSDEHLHDSRELVLRASGVREGDVPVHTEDVDRGGALHRGALGDGEEVMAVPAGASSACAHPTGRNGVQPSASVSAIEEEARSS